METDPNVNGQSVGADLLEQLKEQRREDQAFIGKQSTEIGSLRQQVEQLKLELSKKELQEQTPQQEPVQETVKEVVQEPVYTDLQNEQAKIALKEKLDSLPEEEKKEMMDLFKADQGALKKALDTFKVKVVENQLFNDIFSDKPKNDKGQERLELFLNGKSKTNVPLGGGTASAPQPESPKKESAVQIKSMSALINEKLKG